MKMQLWNILVGSGVNDEAVAGFGEFEFGGQFWHDAEDIGEEGVVCGGQVGEAADGFFGNQQNMI